MLLVQSRIVAGGEFGYIVGLQVGGDVAQCPPNNLLDLARVQVNARPEFSHLVGSNCSLIDYLWLCFPRPFV